MPMCVHVTLRPAPLDACVGKRKGVYMLHTLTMSQPCSPPKQTQPPFFFRLSNRIGGFVMSRDIVPNQLSGEWGSSASTGLLVLLPQCCERWGISSLGWGKAWAGVYGASTHKAHGCLMTALSYRVLKCFIQHKHFLTKHRLFFDTTQLSKLLMVFEQEVV